MRLNQQNDVHKAQTFPSASDNEVSSVIHRGPFEGINKQLLLEGGPYTYF